MLRQLNQTPGIQADLLGHHAVDGAAQGGTSLEVVGRAFDPFREKGPGDTISLEPGATYVGNFVLRARQGTDTRPIVLRTAGAPVLCAWKAITSPADRKRSSSRQRPHSRQETPCV